MDARRQERIEEVQALLDAFCQAKLSPELGGYVRSLWEKVGRTRTYVITGGGKEVWAAAVVYAIARLNFLFDPKSPAYLPPDDICAFFGTRKSTTANKAAEIERKCKIRMGHEGLCDPEISDSLTLLRLPNGLVIPKSMAREMGLL
ncbi:MAG: hypothetical protein FJ291_12160 [Planctomycetes bacterium]|nr:hypothetical protein [Planctomycetota bacterium]